MSFLHQQPNQARALRTLRSALATRTDAHFNPFA